MEDKHCIMISDILNDAHILITREELDLMKCAVLQYAEHFKEREGIVRDCVVLWHKLFDLYYSEDEDESI